MKNNPEIEFCTQTISIAADMLEALGYKHQAEGCRAAVRDMKRKDFEVTEE